MRDLINFPNYSIFILLLSFIVSTNLYAQNGNGNGGGGNTEPTILEVTATNKSVCPTSTINISFSLKNGRGSASSGAYFTTSTQFTISLIYLNAMDSSVIVNSKIPFSLTSSEIPSAANDATSLNITRTYTIPIDTATRSDYRIEISSNNPDIAGNILSRSGSFTISDNNYWSGAVDSYWNKAGNWDCDLIPSFINNAVVNNVSTSYPLLNIGAAGECKNLTVSLGSSLKILDNTLNISESVSNSGTFNSLNGSIGFVGSSAQTIPANTFSANRIRNLIINNTSGVNSSGNLEITGFLKVENGNINTGDALSLISDATQTALIDGSGNGQVVGLVKMQRYLDIAFGYKYFSSPFQNSVVEDFDPFMDFADPTTDFPHAYRYNENRNIEIGGTLEDATGWEVHTGNLNIAEGYALNFGNTLDPVLVEISGEVNNGTLEAKTLLNNHRKYTRGFHLVGNPYPSPIDWDAGNGWTRNNIDNAIYFFTASDTDQYTGNYTSYVNEVSTEDPTVDGRSSNIIPSMQGFFIKVSDSDTQDLVTGSFGMDNRVRINNFTQEFLKAQKQNPKQLLRLTAGFIGEIKKDATVIYFSPYSTLDFEKEFDAHKLMNSNKETPNFYNITRDKKELAINAIPFPTSGNYNKIPLGIKAEKSGRMSIALNAMENLSSRFNIYLIDHFRKIGQNLSQNPDYVFDIKEGTHNARFELMFSEEKITNPAFAFNEPFHVEVINNEVVVKLNLEDDQEGILQASTMIGQVLQIKKGSGQEQVELNGITSNGVYIINLLVGESRYSKKVLIKK